MRSGPVTLAALLTVAWSIGVHAETVANCHVPTASHPTIQDAVNDPICETIAIEAGTFIEALAVARDLRITGDSSATTIIEGSLAILGTFTVVAISDLTIDAGASPVAGCFLRALSVDDGASMTCENVRVYNGFGDTCPVFADGFESGTTYAWSSTSP